MTTDRWGRAIPGPEVPRRQCPGGCGRWLTEAQYHEHLADPWYDRNHRGSERKL